mmetsp:Transcript_138999/g.352394  ORF Transcript_138999/g.352394 Transcript_138999/m.352394 type:complete len:207 (-) Transcript_138999:2-622(-)
MTAVFKGPPPICGENSSEKLPDTAIKTISHSCAASTEKGSTVMSPNLDFTTVPAALLAKSRTFSVGNCRSSRHLSISWPTAPDEPTMPTQPTLPAATATPTRRACCRPPRFLRRCARWQAKAAKPNAEPDRSACCAEAKVERLPGFCAGKGATACAEARAAAAGCCPTVRGANAPGAAEGVKKASMATVKAPASTHPVLNEPDKST